MTQEILDIGFAHDRTTGKEDWLTPPEILKALGEFDLDPCAPMNRPWDMARKHYTFLDNGLTKPWIGRIWLNPPYGNETPRWMERLAKHGNGVALIFARTETATFFPWVWDYSHALLFLKGRVAFFTKEGRRGGPAGAPSVLIAYGERNAETLKRCRLEGAFVNLKRESSI
jgi:DNA N-6-adenine-methyltransferase (Dam)